jgi:hypothetical protein
MSFTPPTEIDESNALSDGIDFSRRFMPEKLTPFFFTPAYGTLTEEQKLRYNQLHACYFNEQTIFFESAMARCILRDFLAQKLPGGLAEGLQVFISEEAEHSEMFRKLNRSCRPNIYSKGDFYFIRVPAISSLVLRQWAGRAHYFPFFLWILLVQEERALYFGKKFLEEDSELEPNFVATQRRHLADEVGHIGWDEELLDWVWPRLSKTYREFNSRLFIWMMGEYFTTPKRSGLHVVAELVNEFPELRPRWQEFQAQMLRLSQNEQFNLSCYSRDITPKSFARFDQWPEFRALNKILPGYRPPTDAPKPPK